MDKRGEKGTIIHVQSWFFKHINKIAAARARLIKEKGKEGKKEKLLAPQIPGTLEG